MLFFFYFESFLFFICEVINTISSCDLMVVQDIQEVAQYLELKFKITMSWKDARVSYYNIKQQQDMNSLTMDEQQALWTTTIVFWNTKEQLRTVKGAFKYYVSKFSIIFDPPPPPASALSAQTKTPHPPQICWRNTWIERDLLDAQFMPRFIFSNTLFVNIRRMFWGIWSLCDGFSPRFWKNSIS